MTMRSNLTRSALLLLLALFCATQLKAAEDDAVARVIISLGTVEAIATDGTVRDLERGDPIYEGDTVRSGARARAQLRFTDGARMSIRPDSEISVDDYEFQESAPPQRARSALSLRRGGFRTATGRIADRNRSAYRVSTPFAVIGVRGTDWSAAIADLGQGDNLFLGVDQGSITAENNAGSLDVGEGGAFSFARIRSFDAPPEGLTSLPTRVATSFRGTPLPPSEEDDGPGPPPDDGAQPGPPADDEDDGAGPPGPGEDDGDGVAGGPAEDDGEAVAGGPGPDGAGPGEGPGQGPGDGPGEGPSAPPPGGPDDGPGGPAGGPGPEGGPLIAGGAGPDGEIEITGPITSGAGPDGGPLPPVFESGLGCF